MRAGFKPFLVSFFLSLGVLLPFVWCGLLWYDASHTQSQSAAQPQSGVSIAPGSQTSCVILAALAPWEECDTPSLTLLRFDGPQCQITACPLAAGTVLRTPGGQTTLAESYLTAGPGRAAQLLADTLEIPQPLYLAAVPAGWEAMLAEPVIRLDTASLPMPENFSAPGLESGVAEVNIRQAAALCAAADGQLTHAAALQLRCAVWESALQQTRSVFSGLCPSLRSHSSSLLTSLSAQDLMRLDDLFSYLAQADGVQVTVCTMPGEWQGQRFALNAQSLQLAAQLAA